MSVNNDNNNNNISNNGGGVDNNNLINKNNINDQSKKIIHFIWVTSEQLISCGRILQAIQCLESLIRFKQDDADSSTIVYNILDEEYKKKEDKYKKIKKKCAKKLVPFQLSYIEESITRLKIAELLYNYTLNYNDARFHLEKASLLLSSDQSSHTSLDLLCKISYFLIEIFHYGGSSNLAKQWVKRSLKYSSQLNYEWNIYFLLKESFIALKENNTQLAYQSLSTAYKISLDVLHNPFLQVLLNTIKCHFNIMLYNYQSLQETFAHSQQLINNMDQQILSISSYDGVDDNDIDTTILPPFYQYIIKFPTTNQCIQSRSLKLKIKDANMSFKQLKVYFNLVKSIYQNRIGCYKEITNTLESLLVDLQHMFNELQPTSSSSPSSSTTNQNPIPIFYFTCGPQYLSCVCYIMAGIHSRFTGEIPKSMLYFEKSIELIESQLHYVYRSTNGNITPAQMKESRSLIRLKFLIHENLFYIYSTSLELELSFQQLQQCIDIYLTYPTLFLDGAESTIYYLASLFCQSLLNFDLAKEFLHMALKKSTRFDQQIHCIIRLVSCHIYLNELDRSNALIKDYLSQLENHPQLTLRSISLFLEGFSLVTFAPELAKDKFRECLLLSNNQIGSTQLTANVLNQLAKLYLSIYPDSSQIPPSTHQNIKNMLDSSLSLSNLINDISTELYSFDIYKNLNNNNNSNSNSNNNDSNNLFEKLKVRDNIINSFPVDKIEFLRLLLKNGLQSLANNE
ncbi:hypothetical protein CYY_000644 [Polysphondylium violaceum]|uniref:Uncharacterized protein n=1 Tax=Polysphondylium violaceum TaxID=133409 RepID=A0A8J4Q1C9_9MYCE|nr:hypothetical protein CYY_000644 [Polysphondylium violaceum]